MENKSVHQILTDHLGKRKAAKHGFSLRMMASRMAVTPGYLSKLLRGLKPISVTRLHQIGHMLNIDDYEMRALEGRLISAQGWSVQTQANMAASGERAAVKYKFVAESHFWLLEKWYYLAILDLVDCQDFQDSAEWIAAQLELKVDAAERAWSRIKDAGFATFDGNKWSKVDEKIIFPSPAPSRSIRNYYIAMFQRAQRELERDSKERFAQRLILGGTVSANEASFARAKIYLEEALAKAGDILNEGPRDRVYFLGFNLLPLALPRKPRA